MNDYFQGPNTLYGIRQDVKSKIGLEHKYKFEGSAQSEVIKTIEVLVHYIFLDIHRNPTYFDCQT